MNLNKYKIFYDIFYDRYDKEKVFLERVIEYYSIFDGYMLELNINKDFDIFDNIYKNIILKYKEIKAIIDNKYLLEIKEKSLLERIAIGDRRAYTALKKEKISQSSGSYFYNNLIKIGILEIEHSREKPINRLNNKYIKKEFRGYQIQHKYKFKNSFLRFWFNFIEPNMDFLEKELYHKVLEKIERHFESFVSLTFEELSNLLINKKFNNHIKEIGSYWDKKIEIDLLCKLSNNITIVGECKWKNHKISKKILNSLVQKSLISNLDATYFALFSKRGFSKELKNIKNNRILLYDLKSFERLIND